MDVSPALKDAVKDYFFLQNKAYPEKASVALVGDRYRLSKDERMVLFRGITSYTQALARKNKLVSFPASRELHIDGYNVLFTLMNYRLGKLLFIGNDGYLRDAGGTHGRIGNQTLFLEIAGDFFCFLTEAGIQRVYVYLDSPVSHSALHAGHLRSLMERHALEGGCELCESADYALKRKNPPCIASADTAIIDALPGPFFDSARWYLQNRYGTVFLDLSLWVSPGADEHTQFEK